MREIWFGLLQIGSFGTGSLFYIVLDVIFTAVAAYVVIQAINTPRGARYLLFLAGGLALLIISSLVALPGLHLFAQANIIGLVVALPILFKDRWQQMLEPKAAVNEIGSQPVKAFNNAAVGGLAVLFSLLVVGVSTGITTRTGTFPDGIKLAAVNVPDGLSASFGSVQTVDVLISAPREKWQSLTGDSFSAAVDLGQQKEGTYTLAVNVTSKVNGIKVIKTDPGSVVVTVEPVIKKTVPVVVAFSGKAGNNLIPDTPDITPATVDITGPKSVISTLTQVAAPLKLDNQTTDIDQKIDLQAQTPDGGAINTVTIVPNQAEVKVALVKSGKIKTVPVVATLTGQPKSGYWVQTVAINPTVVDVTGPVDQLASLTQIPTVALSVDGLSTDKTQTLTLNLPSGISIAGSTSTVSVVLTIAPTATTKTITPQLVYGGLSSNLQVTATSPTSISAIVSGASPALSSLLDGDVKITLDLSPYKSAGTYILTILNGNFTLPNGISLVSFLPSAISVTVSNK
ncbi:MAG TPA: CdaR family protein [Candidatus Saccharimonadales bacterium]|nr:CdaR family protein [Candidatus Saccharimonadales bacterium]